MKKTGLSVDVPPLAGSTAPAGSRSPGALAAYWPDADLEGAAWVPGAAAQPIKEAPDYLLASPSKSRRQRRSRGGTSGAQAAWASAAALVLGAAALLVWSSAGATPVRLIHTFAVSGGGGISLVGGTGAKDTLVVYVYSNTDPEYEANLMFFLQHGVGAQSDPCDYVLVVQEGANSTHTELPPLPPSVRVLRHANECFDWGTFGWALSSGGVDSSGYRYVILLNSSVRGPFLPPYWPRELHWSRALTARLTAEVKLVGATISCEPSWEGGVLTGERRQNPHVQSYLLATDQVGLEVLRQCSESLKCWSSYHDAIWHAEVGSSAAMLEAGYNLDSLLLRYQGLDWRDARNWDCNAGLNPYAESMYDGINVSPFEVLFVKVKEFLLEAEWTAPLTAKKYSEWLAVQHGPAAAHEVRSNEYTAKSEQLRQWRTSRMRARGSACFDVGYYRQRNPDIPWPDDALWEHFVRFGQHEGRPFRFRCPAAQGGGQATQGAPQRQQQQVHSGQAAAVAALEEAAGGSQREQMEQQIRAAAEALSAADAASASLASPDARRLPQPQEQGVRAGGRVVRMGIARSDLERRFEKGVVELRGGGAQEQQRRGRAGAAAQQQERSSAAAAVVERGMFRAEVPFV